mgnify:FL=1|jgi:hypothetical protein|tara:strand:- start:610 stop:864 length:255 start_codon:yes stop_codon:yes gene_type:complete
MSPLCYARHIPVQGHQGFVRDTSTGAVLNIDRTGIEQARQNKKNRLEQRKQQENLAERVSSMEEDITSIRSLLEVIAQRLNNVS